MAKLRLPSFFSKFQRFPHIENLSPFRTVILRLVISVLPWFIAGILIQHIGVVLIVLGLAWIPYSVWLALCKIYKWKDSHKESED